MFNEGIGVFDTEIRGEMKAGESAQTRKELESLITTWNKSTFDIAELLYKVKKNKYYTSYGFDSFLEYVSELEIKKRKAQYLVRIVKILDELGIPREQYEDLGIAKLREITSLDLIDDAGDPAVYDNGETGETIIISEAAKGLVARGMTMSLDEIKKYVKMLKGFTGENDTTWLNICVNTEALEKTIRPALELAYKNLGSAGVDEEGKAVEYSEGKALEVISTEYLNDPANTPHLWEKS